jgi:hypothetical protein
MASIDVNYVSKFNTFSDNIPRCPSQRSLERRAFPSFEIIERENERNFIK